MVDRLLEVEGERNQKHLMHGAMILGTSKQSLKIFGTSHTELIGGYNPCG